MYTPDKIYSKMLKFKLFLKLELFGHTLYGTSHWIAKYHNACNINKMFKKFKKVPLILI